MVKIKVEKEFTKKEFLHYLFNDEENISLSEIFDGTKRKIVAEIESNVACAVSPLMNGNYQVWVEEEVTEETEIPLLLEVRHQLTVGKSTVTHINEKISRILAKKKDRMGIITLTIHKINSDGTTTLLWTKEGGMIE